MPSLDRSHQGDQHAKATNSRIQGCVIHYSTHAFRFGQGKFKLIAPVDSPPGAGTMALLEPRLYRGLTLFYQSLHVFKRKMGL